MYEGVSPRKPVHRRSCRQIIVLESITDAILFALSDREQLCFIAKYKEKEHFL